MSEVLKFEYKIIDSKFVWWQEQLINNEFTCLGLINEKAYSIIINNYVIGVLIFPTSLTIQVQLLDDILFTFANIPLDRPDLFGLHFEQAQTFMNERYAFLELT